MKQMTKKIMPLMSTLLLLVAMLVPIGAWGQYYKAELFTNNPKKGTKYAYLGDAIEYAKASKKQPTTVKLLENDTLGIDANYVFDKGDVTLDLNGDTIFGEADQILKIVAGGKLTIIDSSTEQTGRVLNTKSDGHAIKADGGSLTIHGGSFEGKGWGLYVTSSSADVSLDGGRFISSGNYYGGVCNTYGKSALAYGYAYYNTASDKELGDYTNRPICDETGTNYAKDITVKKASVKATLTVGSTTTDCYTFEKAFEDAMNAGSAATLKMMADYKLPDGKNVTFDKGDVTLDLNGHTLSAYNSEVIKVAAGGKLTITDTSAGKAGKVWNKGSHAINAAGGSLTIHAGTFESTGGAWGLWMSNSVNITLDGGRFVGNGGAVYYNGKSALSYGYAYYNTTSDKELADYTDRPIQDETGKVLATDVTVKKASVKATLTVGSTTTDCYTFEKAFEDAMNAGSAATVKMMADYKLPDGKNVTFNTGDVTLDLNGHTLSAFYSEVIKVAAGGKLTITDTSADKAGKVWNKDSHAINAAGGSLTIHAGTFETNGGGSWALNVTSPSANVTLDGGRFISNGSGGSCGAVYYNGKSFLAHGYAYYNTTTDKELVDYIDKSIKDETGNVTATDVTVKKASVKATLTVGSTTTDCYTFKKAFEDAMNAGSAATVKLMQDGDYFKIYGTYDDFVTFDKGDVTLDLNGHTLSTSSGAVINVAAGGKLTITDTSADKAGKVLNKGGHGINAAGSLTIHAGTFQGGAWGLMASSSANISIDGGRFVGNGGAVNAIYGKSTLAYGYAYYNTTSDKELGNYLNRPIADENGKDAKDITVKKASVKATLTVGSTTTDCYTFEKAFEDAMNAGSAATVKLLQDGDYYKLYGFYADFVTFNKGDVTLDLNGHTLSTSSGAVLKVVEGGKLTITDTSADKAGKVLNKSDYGVLADGGSLTIHAGNFQGGSWGLYMIDASANISIDGGRFIGNSGGVCASYGKSTLAYGYAYYNTTTGAELGNYLNRPICDENGNTAKDITVKKASVKATVIVASTGNMSFSTDCYTFEKAFEVAMNAGSAATVKLLQDGDYFKLYGLYDTFVTFDKGDVTVDLNGHTLSTSSGAVLKVVEGGKLTVTDTSADKSGKLVNKGGPGINADGGSITVHAGTIQGGTYGLRVNNSSVKASVDGGQFIGGAGAVYTYGTSALAKFYAYYDTTTGVALEDNTSGAIKDANGNDVKDITVKINPDVVAANKFKEDHADILAETVNSVTLDDKDTVEDALADYDKLSDGAKSLLTEEKQLLDDMLDKINGWLEAGDALKDLQEKYNDLINDKVMIILINSDEKLSAELYDEIAPEMEKLEDLMKQGIETGDPTYSEFKDIIAGLSDDIDKLKNDAMSLYPEGPYAPIIVDLMGINQQVAKLNERDGDIRGDLKLTNLWNRVMDQIAAEQNRLVWDVENNPDPSDLRLAFHYTNLALIHTSIAIYDEAVKQHLTKDEKIQSIFDALLKLVSSRDKMAYQYGPYLDDQPEWKSICARLEVEETAVNALEGSDPTVEELNAHETELSAISAAMEAFAAKLASDPTGISSAMQNAESGMQNIYNLRGQKVSSNFKGIVIKNGKKVMVK